MGKKASYKGKKQYAVYASQNRAQKNKVKRLERVVKQQPNNEVAKQALERAKKGDFKVRTKPTRMASRLNTFDIAAIAKEKEIAREKMANKNEKVRDIGAKMLKEASAKRPGSLQGLDGRISSLGKKVQKWEKQSRAARNQAMYDRNGKIFPKWPTGDQIMPTFTSPEARERFVTQYGSEILEPKRTRRKYNKKKK